MCAAAGHFSPELAELAILKSVQNLAIGSH